MKYLLLFMMGLALQMDSKAQSEFAPIGAIWHHQNGYHDFMNGYTYYVVEKDTTYIGVNCRKVNRLLVESNTQNGIDSTILEPLYLYNNTDTVFYYNNLFESFVPLYVFNVNEGMVLNFHMPFVIDNMPADSMFQVLIDSVSEEMIEGTNLRKIEGIVVLNEDIGMYPDYSYIERLGLLNKQLIPTEESLLGDYFQGKLRCYQDNELSYHAEENLPCDTLPGYTGINEIIQQYKNVSIYPNPVQEDWLQVSFNHAPDGKNFELQLYDVTGRRLVTHFSVHQPGLKVYVADLPQGIYQIQISSKGYVVGRGRFVKQ